MANVATLPKKSRAHRKYVNAAGQVVPGVTTILNEIGWNKNALVAWARKLALQGIDPNKAKDTAAEIGTVAHRLIEAHIAGATPDLSDYSPQVIDTAETCLLAYFDWESRHPMQVVATECALVSEEGQYGGTIDRVAVIDGVMSILDFKSSNGLYPEHKIQIAAYGHLWNEVHPDQPIHAYHLLQLGKEDGSFHHHCWPATSETIQAAWKAFGCARQLYALRQVVAA